MNVVPANGKHRGIVLKSQTVDATITEEEGQIWADSVVWLRLHNPASKPVTVTVSLPGPQSTPLPLPPALELRAGSILIPLIESDSEATAAIAIPSRDSVNVVARYRQPLPEAGGIVTYAYLLSGAEQWAGTPESLRLTVTLRPRVVMRSLLSISPPAHHTDDKTLTWDWESDWSKAPTDVGLAFMTPAWFSEFEAARAAAAADDAAAGEHLMLGMQYRRLASLIDIPFHTGIGFHARYYPAAAAELHAGLVDDGASEVEKARARSMLAELYLEQAGQSNDDVGEYYLQAAAAEIQWVLKSTASAPTDIQLAARIFKELAMKAESAGDSVTAGNYRRQLDGLQAPSQQEAAPESSVEAVMAKAEAALNIGSMEEARTLLMSLYGSQPVEAPVAPPPGVSQTTVTVTTGADHRTISIHFGRDETPERASSLARLTEKALRNHERTQIVASADTVTLTLSAPLDSEMHQLQKQLASALPEIPELDLLRSVLADTRSAEADETDLFRSTWHYVERADLSSAEQRWHQIVSQLENSRARSISDLPAVQSERAQGLLERLWKSDAAAWRRFATNSRVEYRFDGNGTDAGRKWTLRVGDSQEMPIERTQWNLQNIRWAGLLVFVAIAGIAALLWRPIPG